MVPRRIMGTIHPKKPKLREVEPHLQEADGQNRQRCQELLELKAQKAHWLHVTCSESTLREEEKAENLPNDISLAKWLISSFDRLMRQAGWTKRSNRPVLPPYKGAETRVGLVHGENSRRVPPEDPRASEPPECWVFWKPGLRIHSLVPPLAG